MVLLIDGYMGCPAYPGTWHAIRHIVLPNHIDLPHIGREVCLYTRQTGLAARPVGQAVKDMKTSILGLYGPVSWS